MLARVTIYPPAGEGENDPSDVRFGVCGALGGLSLTLTFDVVSDLVDLVKDIAVAVY